MSMKSTPCQNLLPIENMFSLVNKTTKQFCVYSSRIIGFCQKTFSFTICLYKRYNNYIIIWVHFILNLMQPICHDFGCQWFYVPLKALKMKSTIFTSRGLRIVVYNFHIYVYHSFVFLFTQYRIDFNFKWFWINIRKVIPPAKSSWSLKAYNPIWASKTSF